MALVHGVHALTPGQAATVYLDPAHAYAFGPDGALRAQAAYAEAA